MQTLAYCLIPATYDEASFWVTRMLSHFPRRDSQKDGIVIADLAGSMIDDGVSLMACYVTCESAWKGATTENPWMPPSGQILKDAKAQTESYQRQHERLANPKPALPKPAPVEKPDPYGGRKWTDFTEEDKQRFYGELRPMMLSIRRIYLRCFDAPENLEIPD